MGAMVDAFATDFQPHDVDHFVAQDMPMMNGTMMYYLYIKRKDAFTSAPYIFRSHPERTFVTFIWIVRVRLVRIWKEFKPLALLAWSLFCYGYGLRQGLRRLLDGLD